MKQNKGITLVSLVVTIIVLLILVTIGTNVGTSLIRDAKYHNTISQMKVMQTKVNELYEDYKSGNTAIAEVGEEIPANLYSKASQSFQVAKNNNRTEKYIGEDLTGYRYISSDYTKSKLGIENSNLDYIINVEYRTIILLDGVKKDSNTYYSLNEIEDEQFNVEYINPTVVLSKNGGTYTIPTNGSVTIENTLSIVDKPKDSQNIELKLEYVWSRSKETAPTSGWKQAQDGNTIQLENITEEGTYYLWTKITNVNPESSNSIENIQTGEPFIVKKASLNTYVEYAVVHKQMNLDGINYTTYETEHLRGTEYDKVTPTPKTYTGFTFDEQNSQKNVEINPDGTTTIELKYTRQKYQFTLQISNEISVSDSTPTGEYYYGTEISLKATENPGYTFGSWQSSDTTLLANSTDKQFTFTMPAGAIIITPSTTANTYTVNFDAGEGIELASKQVTYNSTYGELPTPTKDGYLFEGWYTGENGTGTKIESTTKVEITENTTLHAKWKIAQVQYTVNHYVHALGSDTYELKETETKTGLANSTLTLEDLKKTIEGATYVEGFENNGDTSKPSSGAVTTITILPDETRVINLYYRRNYLYVQYDMNGGNLATEHASNIRSARQFSHLYW